MFRCLECGKGFRTVAAARKAMNRGCPNCNGGDIDLDNRVGAKWDKWAERTPAQMLAAVKPGTRVQIVDRFGKTHTGRAVMPAKYGGWVLNMGGKHGTPGIATERNTVWVYA